MERLLPLVIAACGGSSPQIAPPPATQTTAAPPLGGSALAMTGSGSDGLDLVLSAGTTGAPAYDHAQLAPATVLGSADADALLARAPAIQQDRADTAAFALRAASQPPPRTGETVTQSFPPPASTLLPPVAAHAGPLRVLRAAPEGDVPVAPAFTITFSEPMIAVTSQADAAASVPVQLSPQPAGHWRWLGTRTLEFEPDRRMPQATSYRATVPAGTRAASGSALAEAFTIAFETPAPSLVQWSPDGTSPQRLDVPLFLVFDQRIDPAAVAPHVHAIANGTPIPLHLVAATEIATDATLSKLAAAAHANEQDGRWLAARPDHALPVGASVQIVVDAGTPSAEGPRTTPAPQTRTFHTYDKLRVEDSQCGGGGSNCRAGNAFYISFDNPLDEQQFDPASLAITPALPDAKITAQGTALYIAGDTAARTHYRVTLPARLTDTFGQRLGADTSVEFDVHDAMPAFYGPSGLVVLDPAAPPTLNLFTTNYAHLHVQLYRVTADDFPAYGNYIQNRWNHDHPVGPPGTRVVDTMLETSTGANKLVETSIDLKPALGSDGLGHVIAIVEPSPWTQTYAPPQSIVWIESTRLGLDVSSDAEQLVAYTTELATGAPAAGVTVQLAPTTTTAKSDATGVATLALPDAAPGTNANYVVARRGGDSALLSQYEGYYPPSGTYVRHALLPSLSWYVTDDRHIYKPGEQVSIKGWLRSVDEHPTGDVGAAHVSRLTYQVTDARGVKLATGAMTVDAAGSFDTHFALPKTPNLGTAMMRIVPVGAERQATEHYFEIQEFRTPEFEVTAHASQASAIVGGSADITVGAHYYAGGALGGAPVEWQMMATQTQFTPPNRSDFIFGRWVPWFEDFDDDPGAYKPPQTWSLDGQTDAAGEHVAHFEFRSVAPALPMSIVASASVTDVNRQQWSASTVLLVHPADRYVGLKPKRAFVDQGTPYDVDVIGVDLDGKAAPGAAIDVHAVRLDWAYEKGTYVTKELDPQTCSVVAADAPQPCRFATPKGGHYRVTATIHDAKGRANMTELSFWVSGGDVPRSRGVSAERVQLVPDRASYGDGDTADILVQAPFFPAEGVVTLRRGGIAKVEHVALTGATTTLHVPISDAMTPNAWLQVELVGMAARTGDDGQPDPGLPKRPAYAVGTVRLAVPPSKRALAVTAAPSAAKVAPGERASVAVDVRDAAGAPVANAEVAVMVVDEAVLALAGTGFVDPLDAFYPLRVPGVDDRYLQGSVQLGHVTARSGRTRTGKGGGGGFRGGAAMDPDGDIDGAPPEAPREVAFKHKRRLEKTDGAEANEEWAAGSGAGGASTTPIAVRIDFSALAAFAPAVHTDAKGHATVAVKMPDNLTRYRIVAIASAGAKQFGKGESALTARLPLMVRPSPPRFLNFGDTLKLPVVVQNQTDAPLTVRVAVRATNAAITGGAGREVTVPANDRVEVQFPAAAELAGTARFQVVASAAGPGAYRDAAEVSLPVWTPATTEAFATYGVIDSPGDGAVAQPVALPAKVWPQFGGLEVTTASTNLQSLTDALLYLVHYPYECAEQRGSRIQAIAALRDVLTAFKSKDLPSPAEMEATVKADVEHLSQMQNSDGGFAFWDRGYPSEPYLSVFVANALGHAAAKGFAVPPEMIAHARAYLADVEQHIPAFYPDDVRHAISAYALDTRAQLGDVDVAKAKTLLAQWGGPAKVSMETDGWLLGTLAGRGDAVDERAALMTYATNHVSETAGAANFTTSYHDGNYLLLSSDHRVDAVMLEALIAEQPQSDVIPKVVTGLLAHRKAGKWLDTQESSFALVALDKYFQTYEKATPDFVARVWLGKDYAGDHAFRGHTTERAEYDVAMTDVASHDRQDLTIAKHGAGRLYYRIGMTYAPESLKVEPADYGFVVERRYEAVDDPKDVTRAADGTWHVKAGARVRVRVTMVNDNRRYQVALVDPLPAGFEAMNPALATTGPIPLDPAQQAARGRYWWFGGAWYEHQNLRDERVEAFASLLWEGVHDYNYVARATTPGNFVVPPPKAEEMYMPETFGRGASDRVVVE
nr:DUF6049 family protein [Kofleriaceae bacterium]